MALGIINTAISFFSSKLSFVLKIEAIKLYMVDNCQLYTLIFGLKLYKTFLMRKLTGLFWGYS